MAHRPEPRRDGVLTARRGAANRLDARGGAFPPHVTSIRTRHVGFIFARPSIAATRGVSGWAGPASRRPRMANAGHIPASRT